MKSNSFSLVESLDSTSRSLIVWSLFIFTAVCVFNLPYVFFDGLIHDDAFWFYRATEGNAFIESRGKVSAFVPYMDNLYSKGMLYLGTDLLHFTYISVMGMGSTCAYFFYRKVFLLGNTIAVPAAIIPNILPSLALPLGFNASYAIWQIPPFFLSLICLHIASKVDSPRSYILYGISFLLYCFVLNVSISGTFLIPVTILFFLVMIEKGNEFKVFIRSVPFLFFGIYHLYKHSHYSHKTPVINSIDVVLDRLRDFIEMANFLPLDNNIAIWIIVVLSVSGLIAICVKNDSCEHFEVSPDKYQRVFIILWLLCWLGANSVAYLVFSPSFRPNDYSYTFNYVSVLLLLIGAYYWLCLLKLKLQRQGLKNVHRVIFILATVFLAGSQRIYAYYSSAEISNAEETSKELRLLLSDVELPNNAQLIILGIDVPHNGVDKVNSGYIRYLTGRDDLRALIGQDRYPLDPFGVTGSWLNPMKNLDEARPIITFRQTDNGIENVKYLLQTTVNNKGFPRFIWHLYDISNKQVAPVLLNDGKGVDSYLKYVEDVFTEDKPFVAFSPEIPADKILNAEQAAELIRNGDTFQQRVNYSNVVTLFGLQETDIHKNAYLKVLIRIDKVLKYRFKLGYKIRGENEVHTLDSSDYLVKGDYLSFYHPLKDFGSKILARDIQFYYTGVWPYKEILLLDE